MTLETTEKVSFNMVEAQALSLDLLQFLEDEQITIIDASAALALSLARMVSPTRLTTEQEGSTTPQLIEYAAMLVSTGPRVH